MELKKPIFQNCQKRHKSGNMLIPQLRFLWFAFLSFELSIFRFKLSFELVYLWDFSKVKEVAVNNKQSGCDWILWFLVTLNLEGGHCLATLTVECCNLMWKRLVWITTFLFGILMTNFFSAVCLFVFLPQSYITFWNLLTLF